MQTPREIVDTMIAKHGVATSDDISKLREPLSRALASSSDLANHMVLFLLASQRLTRSGQGEKDYRYFELFLETVSLSHDRSKHARLLPAVPYHSTAEPVLGKIA
jgi:hypothetical protein